MSGGPQQQPWFTPACLGPGVCCSCLELILSNAIAAGRLHKVWGLGFGVFPPQSLPCRLLASSSPVCQGPSPASPFCACVFGASAPLFRLFFPVSPSPARTSLNNTTHTFFNPP